jgi:hypothetical protein
MQSFIQYRKFRQQVQRQYDRHASNPGRELAPTRPDNRSDSQLASRPSSSSSLESSTSSLPRSEQLGGADNTDIEKFAAPLEKPSDDTIATNGSSDPEKDATAGPGASAEQEADQTLRSDLKSRPTPPDDGHLSRATTHATHKSHGAALGLALTGIDARDRTTNEGGTGKVFVVGYEGENDPLNPHNWSYASRLFATSLIAGIAFVVGFASAIDSSALRPAAEDFGVSQVTESLATGSDAVHCSRDRSLRL